jgi:hypothetical protein
MNRSPDLTILLVPIFIGIWALVCFLLPVVDALIDFPLSEFLILRILSSVIVTFVLGLFFMNIIGVFRNVFYLLNAIFSKNKINFFIYIYSLTKNISIVTIIFLTILSLYNIREDNIQKIFILKSYMVLCFISFVFTIINICTKYFIKFTKISNEYLQEISLYENILSGYIKNIFLNRMKFFLLFNILLSYVIGYLFYQRNVFIYIIGSISILHYLIYICRPYLLSELFLKNNSEIIKTA